MKTTKSVTMPNGPTVQRVFDGAVVIVFGYEFIASNVVWTTGANGRKVEFTGTCTSSACNDDIRHTGYNGGRYGGNAAAGYVE